VDIIRVQCPDHIANSDTTNAVADVSANSDTANAVADVSANSDTAIARSWQ